MLAPIVIGGMFTSAFAQPEVSEKWVITPVPIMKGVLGRLDINFPVDIERNILIYKQSDNKFLTSVSCYSLAVSLNLAFSIAGHGAIHLCSAVSRYTKCS